LFRRSPDEFFVGSGLTFESSQYFFRVKHSIDLGVDRENVSLGADDVAHPLGVGGVLALTGAVGEPDVPRGVAEQREVEVELLGKSAILVFRVEADSQNLRVLLLELSDVVAEPATFRGSAGSIGLGVEPEDDDLPEVVP
jgi:hypothetical protein